MLMSQRVLINKFTLYFMSIFDHRLLLLHLPESKKLMMSSSLQFNYWE